MYKGTNYSGQLLCINELVRISKSGLESISVVVFKNLQIVIIL